jgi:hypothetical protein
MPNILLHYLTFSLHYLNISFVKVMEKNVRYWRVNVGHYGEEMLGTKENKSLLELSQRPKYHPNFFLNVFHAFSRVRWVAMHVLFLVSVDTLRGLPLICFTGCHRLVAWVGLTIILNDLCHIVILIPYLWVFDLQYKTLNVRFLFNKKNPTQLFLFSITKLFIQKKHFSENCIVTFIILYVFSKLKYSGAIAKSLIRTFFFFYKCGQLNSLVLLNWGQTILKFRESFINQIEFCQSWNVKTCQIC